VSKEADPAPALEAVLAGLSVVPSGVEPALKNAMLQGVIEKVSLCKQNKTRLIFLR
jgi:hypothetical protein